MTKTTSQISFPENLDKLIVGKKFKLSTYPSIVFEVSSRYFREAPSGESVERVVCNSPYLHISATEKDFVAAITPLE